MAAAHAPARWAVPAMLTAKKKTRDYDEGRAEEGPCVKKKSKSRLGHPPPITWAWSSCANRGWVAFLPGFGGWHFAGFAAADECTLQGGLMVRCARSRVLSTGVSFSVSRCGGVWLFPFF